MIESRMSRCFIVYWLVLGRGIILFYFSIHQLVFFLPVIVVICPVPLFPILVFPYILFPIRVSKWFYSSLFSLLLFISNNHSFGYSGSFITLDAFLFPFKANILTYNERLKKTVKFYLPIFGLLLVWLNLNM